MTVYNCGPIYYTVCLSCLKISLHVPSLLYHIGLRFFCTCYFFVYVHFNLQFKLPSCLFFFSY